MKNEQNLNEVAEKEMEVYEVYKDFEYFCFYFYGKIRIKYYEKRK